MVRALRSLRALVAPGLVLIAVLHGRTVAAQTSTSRAVADSARLDRVHGFAGRLRALLDSQSVEGLAALTTASSTTPHGDAPAFFRFLGPAQILSAFGGHAVGPTSGLSIVVVSPDLWMLTGVDDTSRSVNSAPRVWTALVDVSGTRPRLLHLHVSKTR